ncbi:hypothetical protein [Natronoglycomyces albus]|uniref:Uncharacterized protein n=1 Tax=Natronoglycomyces albus TaxID=2811108 RepID=A0A895XH49_9ACTN|nr:hypothetical protein [Natronoglycomyces albus]QSB05171.1 hypothetical protein JQS30_15665 [Natronoglycomyces albus]
MTRKHIVPLFSVAILMVSACSSTAPTQETSTSYPNTYSLEFIEDPDEFCQEANFDSVNENFTKDPYHIDVPVAFEPTIITFGPIDVDLACKFEMNYDFGSIRAHTGYMIATEEVDPIDVLARICCPGSHPYYIHDLSDGSWDERSLVRSRIGDNLITIQGWIRKDNILIGVRTDLSLGRSGGQLEPGHADFEYIMHDYLEQHYSDVIEQAKK